MDNNKVVVTRHAGLVEYLQSEGVLSEGVPVISHATPEDVRGKHVIGVLPLPLAALAASVTVIPLALTPEDRGCELSAERVAEIAGEPQRYRVVPL